jgi:hypothetical protein
LFVIGRWLIGGCWTGNIEGHRVKWLPCFWVSPVK